MDARFTAEDSIICILEEYGECSTSFILSHSPFGRDAIYQRLRKLEAEGVVKGENRIQGENVLKSGRKWGTPRPPHPMRPSKKWRLAK